MKVRVDGDGRIILPKKVREELGIHEGSELMLDIKGEEIVIKIHRGNLDKSLDKRVDELIEFLRKKAPKAFVSEVEEEEKWLTKKYGLEKIGLKG